MARPVTNGKFSMASLHLFPPKSSSVFLTLFSLTSLLLSSSLPPVFQPTSSISAHPGFLARKTIVFLQESIDVCGHL